MTDDDARSSGKRDRLARMLRVAAVLQAHPDGIRPPEIARRVGVTTRTVYRDLHALEDEVEIKTWSADGLWGVVSEASSVSATSSTCDRWTSATPAISRSCRISARDSSSGAFR